MLNFRKKNRENVAKMLRKISEKLAKISGGRMRKF